MLFVVPPQIVPFEFGEEAINSGEIISAVCTINKGDFPLNITWTLNDQNVGNMKGITVLRTNKRISQLSIDDVQASHSGTYRCIVENDAGVSHHEALLRVNGISNNAKENPKSIARYNFYKCKLVKSLIFVPSFSLTKNSTILFWRRAFVFRRFYYRSM